MGHYSAQAEDALINSRKNYLAHIVLMLQEINNYTFRDLGIQIETRPKCAFGQ